MSDKGFGDYTNRNVVKNPLLSTAVTGMSLEDLTHNAVLLPAVPNQGLIASQDATSKQLTPLADVKLNENVGVQTKPKDDFDVDEYFARLQGTRYVSAPIDCARDQNANLETEEDNLEEINLNESNNEAEHSITSDIAQNFSQLPQVLPQVASAVFSSFSNMLSLKSREQSPDEVKRSQADVGVEVNKAAPLKEPPRFAGTTNTYRIAAKKKTYAPIPGLSSGDAAPTIQPPLGIPSNTGLQSLFDPTAQANLNRPMENLENVYVPPIQAYAEASTENLLPSSAGLSSMYDPKIHAQQDLNRPVATLENIPKDSFNTEKLQADSNQPIAALENVAKDTFVGAQDFRPVNNKTTLEINDKTNDIIQQHTELHAGIIPPPPMFSSIPQRTEGPSVVSRAIVPPSVARRISNKANKPIQTVETNFFIPQMPETSDIDVLNNNTTQEANVTQVDQSAATSFNPLTHAPIESSNMTQSPLQEPPKPIPEPPKIAAAHSFRLPKKRFQFPGTVESSMSLSISTTYPFITYDHSYHGSVFTPTPTVLESTTPLFTPSNEPISETTHAFNNPPSSDVNISQAPMSAINPSVDPYATVFDLSRPYENEPEIPKQDGGFGLLGSLKSKLTSIDINKIQNSVTTFFDPNYNVAETKEVRANEYPQSSNFEVFVPNSDNNQYDVQSTFELAGPSSTQYPTNHYGQYNYQSIPPYPIYGQPVVEANTAETTFTHQPEYSSSKPAHVEKIEHSFNNSVSQINIFTPASVHAPELMTSSRVIESQDVNKDPSSGVNFFSVPSSEPTESFTCKKEDNFFMNVQEIKPVTSQSNFIDEKVMHSPANFFNLQVTNEDSMNRTPAAANMYTNKNQETSNVNFFTVPTDTIVAPDKAPVDIFMIPKEQSIEKQGNVIGEKPANLVPNYFDMPNLDEKGNSQISFTTSEANKIIYETDTSQPNLFSTSTLQSEQLPIPPANYFTSSNLQQTVPPVLATSDETIGGNAKKFFDLSMLAYEVDSKNSEATNTQSNFFDLQHNLETPKITAVEVENKDSTPTSKVDFFSLPNTKQIEDSTTDNSQEVNVVSSTNFSSLTQKEQLPLDVIDFQNKNIKPDQTRSIPNVKEFFDSPSILPQDNMNLQAAEKIPPFDVVPPGNTYETNFERDTMIDNKSKEHLGEKEETDNNYYYKNTVYPDDIAVNTYSVESLPLAVNLPQNIDKIGETRHDTHIPESANQFPGKIQIKTTSISEAERKAIAKKVEKNLATAERVNEMFSNKPTPSIPPGFEMRAIELGIYPSHTTDEIKAKLIAGQTYPPTVPTAPEQDDITDVNTGQLDVNLIEQDAKNYFPIDDDVVEPSEPDNTKEELDSFTDRVDKYNKQERSMILENCEEQVPLYQCFPNTAVTLASYFDTGNYAVETHYRKSLASPSSVTSQLASPSSVFSPDTLEVKSVVEDASGAKLSINETSVVTEVVEEDVADNNKEDLDPKLTDPLNFFSDEAVNEEPNEGFNRLASYFTTPTNSKNTQSFFELSQGQKHLRKNVAEETHKANLELMKDLTSIENYTPRKESVVKTVNYFEVEYFNKLLLKNILRDKETQVNCERDLEELTNSNIVGSQNAKELNTDAQNDKKSAIEETKNDKYAINDICWDTDKNKLLYINNIKIRKNMTSEGNNGNKEKCDLNSKIINSNLDLCKDPLKVNFQEGLKEMEEGWPDTHENRSSSDYEPVKYHWFYRVDRDTKSVWKGFSIADSTALEDAFNSSDLKDTTLVATDGGRYDVNLCGRLRIAVYWSEKPTNVRRCSWFYKGNTDIRYVPYTEAVASLLEDEYRNGVLTGVWHRRLCLPNNDVVVMHGPNVMEHFLSSTNDAWASGTQSTTRQIRRGHDESEIEDNEPSNIDHLLLLCHGVGSACDLKLRPIEDVVEDFRTSSLHLIQGHYKNSYDSGAIGRVEVLPISWHTTLHSGPNGVDRRLSEITLESIPKLRNFTNDTVLDVLFYTSPIFSQIILDTVCSELNRIFELFKKRNPHFDGGVSLGGHSLGSVILYDLLCHQETSEMIAEKKLTAQTNSACNVVKYPKINFNVDALYALGSPIAIFECIRGVELLGEEFKLPTCKAFYNIFHPYDPIAYRIEPLINPELKSIPPYLIPHHKGRKRMHLELKETMARVGADIKQKFVDYMKSTWSIMWKPPASTPEQLEKVVEEQIETEDLIECKEETSQHLDDSKAKLLGKLNGGRRVDYVLQEAPLEIINEYIFAMASHVCYWGSEDTMLMMLREIYLSMDIVPDCTIPQQTLTVERTRLYTSVDDESTISHITDVASTSRDLP